jgi:hypothetical protein
MTHAPFCRTSQTSRLSSKVLKTIKQSSHHLRCEDSPHEQITAAATSPDKLARCALQEGERLARAIAVGSAFKEPSDLSRGLLLVHADLKYHAYRHCFAFPSLRVSGPFTIVHACPLATSALISGPHLLKALTNAFVGVPVVVRVPSGALGRSSGDLQVPPCCALLATRHNARKQH